MKFIDMFADMGTVRMGFEQAGHECVSSIEFDKHKRRIYEVVFGHEPEFGDITAVRGSDLPYADCWCFGAPCQDFSLAGLRAGLDGERSSLVREVFRLIGEKEPANRPEWLLYENVKGMLSSNNGWDFAFIQAEMGELGYDVQWQLLNSKDFGVPQNRERVYTLGHLRAKGVRKVFPIGENDSGINKSNEPTTQTHIIAPTIDTRVGALTHRSPYVVETQVKQIGNVMPTATRDNPNQGRVYDPSGLAPCLNKMEGGGREPLIASGIYTGVSDEYQRGPLNGLTRSLKANKYDAGVLQGTRIRRLTPRECMRLQGVPDYITDKLIAAGISDTQMYRAAGDACTVNVIYEIARRLS